MQLNENKFAVLKKLGLDDVQATADYEKQKTDLLIQQEDLKLKKIQETAQIQAEIQQATVDFLQGLNSTALDMFKAQSDAKIEQFGREKDMSIRAAGENTDAKARIEAEYTKKANAEKRKAAKAEKAAALFSAIINTALAVIKGLNTMPFFPLGIIMAALAGVLGGIQIAAIASKPIPQYRKGTKFAQEGPAIVNDEPGSVFQELIMRDDKAYLPQGRNQMVYLKRGDKVIRAAETKGIREGIKRADELEKMMNESSLQDALAIRLEAGRKLEIIHNMTDAMLGAKVSEKLIGEEVGKHLKDMPQPVNIWDERGHRKGLRKGNSLVIYLNERNSL